MSPSAQKLLTHLPPISGLLFAEFECAPGRLAMPDVACDLIWTGRDLVVVGPMKTGRTVDPIHRHLALVTLDPIEAGRVLRCPLSELTNVITSIRNVSPWLANPLEDLFANGHGARLVRPAKLTRPETANMSFAADALARGVGARRVAASLDVSSRHFRRQFRQASGLSPGEFFRITRFRKAIGLARRGMSLAAASYSAGYADQPHFNRESLRLTGRAPRRVIAGLGSSREVIADCRNDTASDGHRAAR